MLEALVVVALHVQAWTHAQLQGQGKGTAEEKGGELKYELHKSYQHPNLPREWAERKCRHQGRDSSHMAAGKNRNSDPTHHNDITGSGADIPGVQGLVPNSPTQRVN